MATFSTAQRKSLAKQGEAEPGGSSPIRNGADLENAIRAFGRASNPAETKAWIIRRARELNMEAKLPMGWLAGKGK